MLCTYGSADNSSHDAGAPGATQAHATTSCTQTHRDVFDVYTS